VDREYAWHVEWLGYVQPVGLVVSPPAMIRAQAFPNKHIGPDHQKFLAHLPTDEKDEVDPRIIDLAGFTQEVLDWSDEDLICFPNFRQLGGLKLSDALISPRFTDDHSGCRRFECLYTFLDDGPILLSRPTPPG